MFSGGFKSRNPGVLCCYFKLTKYSLKHMQLQSLSDMIGQDFQFQNVWVQIRASHPLKLSSALLYKVQIC